MGSTEFQAWTEKLVLIAYQYKNHPLNGFAQVCQTGSPKCPILLAKKLCYATKGREISESWKESDCLQEIGGRRSGKRREIAGKAETRQKLETVLWSRRSKGLIDTGGRNYDESKAEQSYSHNEEVRKTCKELHLESKQLSGWREKGILGRDKSKTLGGYNKTWLHRKELRISGRDERKDPESCPRNLQRINWS